MILEWRCEKCGEPVEDDHGYLEISSGAIHTYRALKAEWEDKYLPKEGLKFYSLADLQYHPKAPRWMCWHATCDPDPDSSSFYWIGVERLRTTEMLLSFTAHLMGKNWIQETDWDDVIRGQVRVADSA